MHGALIASAAYIDAELAAEYGKLPPAFLPVGHRRLYELQIESLKVIQPSQIFLSLPSSYLIPEYDYQQLSKGNVTIVCIPEGLTLSESVLFALDQIGDAHTNISILHGDTLIRDIPDNLYDTVAMVETPENYEWGFLPKMGAVSLASGEDQEPLALAGYFRFSNKALLCQSLKNDERSFEKALLLYDADQLLDRVVVKSWLDFGHLQTFYRSRCQINTQRSFNHLQINYQEVLKTGENSEKIKAEALWFNEIPYSFRLHTPALLGYSLQDQPWYKLEYLPNPTLHELFVFGAIKKPIWNHILRCCFGFMDECLQESIRKSDLPTYESPLENLISRKSTSRLEQFLKTSRINKNECWSYEGKVLPSLMQMMEITLNAIDLKCIDYLGVMHGDLCFTNIFYNYRTERIQVIDPRGSVRDGTPSTFGDLRYDLAKLAHSIAGYDYILANRYKCDGFDHRNVSIEFPRGNAMDMLSIIGKNFSLGGLRISDREIQAITFHLFFSMLPLHADRPERQRAFFINALRIFSLNFT